MDQLPLERHRIAMASVLVLLLLLLSRPAGRLRLGHAFAIEARPPSAAPLLGAERALGELHDERRQQIFRQGERVVLVGVGAPRRRAEPQGRLRGQRGVPGGRGQVADQPTEVGAQREDLNREGEVAAGALLEQAVLEEQQVRQHAHVAKRWRAV